MTPASSTHRHKDTPSQHNSERHEHDENTRAKSNLKQHVPAAAGLMPQTRDTKLQNESGWVVVQPSLRKVSLSYMSSVTKQCYLLVGLID